MYASFIYISYLLILTCISTYILMAYKGGKPDFPKPDSHYKLPFKQSARTAEMLERL